MFLFVPNVCPSQARERIRRSTFWLSRTNTLRREVCLLDVGGLRTNTRTILFGSGHVRFLKIDDIRWDLPFFGLSPGMQHAFPIRNLQ